MSDFAKEGGHWYKADGSPFYEIEAKGGGMRPVTLRDARKIGGLYPSVTSILRELSAPGLEQWKRQQAILSALTLPMAEGESLDDYAKRVEKDAAEQAKKAAQLGTDIHGAIELRFQGRRCPVHGDRADAAYSYVNKLCGGVEWEPERSFCHTEIGFGGKIDLSGGNVVIDFKTKPSASFGKKLHYDEMCYQLAAYALGLGIPLSDSRLINVFVSTDGDEICHHEWSDEDKEKGLKIFLNTLNIWRLKRGL